MKNIKIKVYHLFWLVALIILCIGIFETDKQNSTLDINIHDTYFVISHFDTVAFLTSGYFLLGLGYWLVLKVFKKKMIKWLTVMHSVILIGSFVVYWIVVLYLKTYIIKPSSPLFDGQSTLNIYLVISLLLIIFIAQPIYVVNLLIGIFRKDNNTIEPNHTLNEKI